MEREWATGPIRSLDQYERELRALKERKAKPAERRAWRWAAIKRMTAGAILEASEKWGEKLFVR